jgi:arylsulfatase A-like enzyme
MRRTLFVLMVTMIIKRPRYWIAGLAACVGLVGFDLPARAAPPRPNVLVCVADDLGWADVGYHGSEIRTPVIDRLVQSGVELDCHYVMPMCTPTRVALLTGRYPSRFGNHCTQAANSQALPFGTPTLAALLQQADYETAIVGKWHLGSLPAWGPNHFGFDYSFGSLAGAVAPYDHRYQLNRPEYIRTFHRNLEFIDEPGHITDLTASEAIQWLRRERVQPFFLYVPFHAPHVPLVEAPQWLARNAHIESDDRRLFAAAVSHMDDALGQIVAAIEDAGQRENTLILFFSDNGGLLNHEGGEYPPPDPPLTGISSNAPWRGYKTELYEGGIRVPAFVSWPGQLPPRKVEAPLHAVDWLPTIARLVGATVGLPAEMDGRDIWPLLTGVDPNPPPRTLYWVTKEDRKWLALRHGRWKIVRCRDQPWQLFDLQQDPGETQDLASRHPGRLQRLLAMYEREIAKDNLEDGS